ncbi:MAG: hypothetical protein A2V86_09340 [Deltaproteobacteria bacterium RBG_16_49_23]|nr:MAG: hypothetical protein A2V86_09340 [Deltaproteobacteria bacterium RBG_16_49_23]
MSNVIGIIAGVVVSILGIFLLIFWWPMFAAVFKGIFPILLILIGLGVLIYYISEIKSKLEMGKEQATTPEESKPR